MLQIKNLTIKDLKNHKFIDHFNFSLGNNDKIGIIGEEGNGKSTFLKAIQDPKGIEEYMVMSGEINCDFQQIGYLPQQLPNEWKETIVCEYLLKEKAEEELPYERYNDLKQYESLCQQLHLSTILLQKEQTMKSLSGGEKVKVQLLKLMHKPLDLLLLDEPSNDLDLETITWMESFLNECKIPVLFISHDIQLLKHCANVIIHFEQRNKQTKCCTTVFHGSYQEYIEQRKQNQNKEEKIANKEKQEYQKKKERLNNQRNAVHDALNDTVRNPGQGALLKKKMANIKAQEKRFEKEGFSKVDSYEEAIHIHFDSLKTYESKIILELKMDQLCIANQVLIKDINLLIKGKDKVIITGENGSGKTTLMKEIQQRLNNRKDITLGYMPQNYSDSMDMRATPITFLLEEGTMEDVTRCRELLGAMNFTSEEMSHAIQEISEGQKAKLYLLRFIKLGCTVLLLDEPTRNLSPLSAPKITGLLKEYQGCMIAISHDRFFIDAFDARRIKLENQRLIES